MQMQITATASLKGEILFKSNKKNNSIIFNNSFQALNDNFVSTCLDSSLVPAPRFDMKGFFLESSVDAKIKSVPIFLFCLQRKEARETFISCFYPESQPSLFEKFNEVNSEFKSGAFFFNWFDHESMVPSHPEHRDEISDAFYFPEGRFLDYRVFNSTAAVSDKARRFVYSRYFRSGTTTKKNFVYRNRFHKRKFDWFLKNNIQ